MESAYVGVSLGQGLKARSPAIRMVTDPSKCKFRLLGGRKPHTMFFLPPAPSALQLWIQAHRMALGARSWVERCGLRVTHCMCPWFCPVIRIVVLAAVDSDKSAPSNAPVTLAASTPPTPCLPACLLPVQDAQTPLCLPGLMLRLFCPPPAFPNSSDTGASSLQSLMSLLYLPEVCVKTHGAGMVS